MADCPICGRVDEGCVVDRVLTRCKHTTHTQEVKGYRAVEGAGAGEWVWQPANMPAPVVLAERNEHGGGVGLVEDDWFQIAEDVDSLEFQLLGIKKELSGSVTTERKGVLKKRKLEVEYQLKQEKKGKRFRKDPVLTLPYLGSKHQDDIERKHIEIENDGYKFVIKDMIAHLSIEQNYLKTIYIQGSDHSDKWPSRLLLNSDGTIRMIDPLDIDKTHVEIEKRFRFSKEAAKGEIVKCPCPDRIAKNFLSEGEWIGMKPLDKISRVPLLQWDGDVYNVPGYYLEAKTVIDINPSDYEVKINPSNEEAKEALASIKYFLREFHFKDLLEVSVKERQDTKSVDRSAAIAALLTAVSRHMYDFAPCFITNAHTPGSGKGTLASVITLIQEGKIQSERTWDPDPVELNKVIVSELLLQPSSIIIGNIDSKFGGSIIESLLTKIEYPARMLNFNKMVFPKTKTLLMANGNNLTISKDMIRRTIMTRLDCGVEKPQDINYEVKDILKFTFFERHKLFINALTILQAFLLSDEINSDRGKLNGFEDWDRLVRGALLWLGEADPMESQSLLHEEDEDGSLLSRFIEAFRNEFGGTEKTPGMMIKRTEATDPLNGIVVAPEYIEVLKEVACPRSKPGEYSSALLGRFLQANQGQVRDGYCIERLARSAAGQPWRLKFMPLPTETDPEDPPF